MSSDLAASHSSPRPDTPDDDDDAPDHVQLDDTPDDASNDAPGDALAHDALAIPPRPASIGSTSIPDDTPSVQVPSPSHAHVTNVTNPPTQGSLVSTPSLASQRPQRPHPLQPFDRRFSSRLSLSPSPNVTPRGPSPAFLSAHSRQSSLSSNLLFTHPAQNTDTETDTPQAPWDVVRWTKLKNITGQLFSEVGRRNFGRPTCLNVAATLVIGTSKGFVLVFDYHQVLKSIIGPGTKGSNKHTFPMSHQFL
jgi:hypothetical protein